MANEDVNKPISIKNISVPVAIAISGLLAVWAIAEQKASIEHAVSDNAIKIAAHELKLTKCDDDVTDIGFTLIRMENKIDRNYQQGIQTEKKLDKHIVTTTGE